MQNFNFPAIGKQSNNNDGFDALPEGRYNLVVEAAEQKIAKSSQRPMIEVTFRVIDGKYKNRKLWHNFSLTEKAAIFLYNFLKATGSSLIDEEDVNTKTIIEHITGRYVTAWTQPGKTPSGAPKNELKNWGPIKEDVIAKALDGEVVESSASEAGEDPFDF